MGYYRSRPHSRSAKQVLFDRSNKKLSTLASFRSASNPQNILDDGNRIIANLANFRGPFPSIFLGKLVSKRTYRRLRVENILFSHSINGNIFVGARSCCFIFERKCNKKKNEPPSKIGHYLNGRLI